MHVGDFVIARIRRQIEGQVTESRWLHEVLAIDKAGDPTHSCSMGKMGTPTNEALSEYNTKDSQHIVDYDELPEDWKYVVSKLPQRFAGKPLDEPLRPSRTTTGIEFIKILASFLAHDREFGELAVELAVELAEESP